MGCHYFYPHGTESVEIKFLCDNCKTQVESDCIRVPEPNFTAEKASDSYNDNWSLISCQNCGKDFTIWVYAGFPDGYVEIDDVDDDDIVEVIENYEKLDKYYEEQITSILSVARFITQFNNEIKNLKTLNDIDLGNFDLQNILQRQIYSGTITCLEDYLSATLINLVLTDKDNFKNFVRTYHGIRCRKFTLNEIYEKLNIIEIIVKKELVDVIYHDLPKVKGMYEDTLKIDFPDISEMMKIISCRHDIVHRNGKDKDGNEIDLSKKSVRDVIKKVETFINEVEEKIENIEK